MAGRDDGHAPRRREDDRCPPRTRPRRPHRVSTTRRHEHDACGVAFVATLTGEASHDIVRQGADRAAQPRPPRCRRAPRPTPATAPASCIQVPDAFLREVARAGFELPPRGAYAVGTAFLPGDDDDVAKARAADRASSPPRRACAVLGWRDVPVAARHRSARRRAR